LNIKDLKFTQQIMNSVNKKENPFFCSECLKKNPLIKEKPLIEGNIYVSEGDFISSCCEKEIISTKEIINWTIAKDINNYLEKNLSQVFFDNYYFTEDMDCILKRTPSEAFGIRKFRINLRDDFEKICNEVNEMIRETKEVLNIIKPY